MLFADYGEDYAGPRQPGYAKVDPLSHRTANGTLVYQRGHALHAPSLPSQYAPVQISTTAPKQAASATTPPGTVKAISMKSTTLPSTYHQVTTITAAKPAAAQPITARPSAPAPSFSTAPPPTGPRLTTSAGTGSPSSKTAIATVTSKPPAPAATVPVTTAVAPTTTVATTSAGGGGGAMTTSRPAAATATPNILLPDGTGTKIATVLQPSTNRIWWYLAGGLGLAAIAGGVYLSTRK